MKLRTTLTIGLLIALATGMTFFVVTLFWQRESALGFAGKKEEVLAQRVVHLLPKTADSTAVAAFLTADVQATGALVGCLQQVGQPLLCTDATPAATLAALQSVSAQTMAAGHTVRSLSGVQWSAFLPHQRYLDIGLYIDKLGQQPQILALRYPLADHYQAMQAMQRYIAGYLGLNFVIVLVLGFFRLHHQLFRPMERLVHMSDSYRDESGVPFLTLRGGDELGQLSVALQQMLARITADRTTMQQQMASLEEANQQLIATREEMVRSEKLSSVGRLAAGLAHEIGNPIGIVQGYLGLLQQHDISKAERHDFCTRAGQELERVSRLVRQLLDLARPSTGVAAVIDTHEVLEEVLELLRPQSLLTGIRIKLHLQAEQSLVHVVQPHLFQVLLNCLINSADAMQAHPAGTGERGVLTVHTSNQITDNKQQLVFSLTDTGGGLSPEAAANAFDPFFTTKAPGKGTGLGLSVSYALITAMGGEIHLADQPKGGARLTIVLPVCQPDHNNENHVE